MELSDKKVVLVERNEKVVYQDGNRVVKAFKSSKPASRRSAGSAGWRRCTGR